MTVRCKFKCRSVTDYGNSKTIEMEPVISGSEENKKFWEYTPNGELKFNTVNKDAVKDYEAGKEYYIDITPA